MKYNILTKRQTVILKKFYRQSKMTLDEAKMDVQVNSIDIPVCQQPSLTLAPVPTPKTAAI